MWYGVYMTTDNTVKTEDRVELKIFETATVNRSAAARALGVNVAHISRILSGQRAPSLKLAFKMAYYFNVTLEKLHGVLYPDAKTPRVAKRDNYYRDD